MSITYGFKTIQLNEIEYSSDYLSIFSNEYINNILGCKTSYVYRIKKTKNGSYYMALCDNKKSMLKNGIPELFLKPPESIIKSNINMNFSSIKTIKKSNNIKNKIKYPIF